MSIQAVAWAIEQQEVIEPNVRLVLICLANCCGSPTGENAFPAIARLCRDSGLSESTVRRCLKQLEKASMIMRGNQAIAAAYIDRLDRRPVVYDLLMPRGVTQTPRKANGVSNDPERGVNQTGTGCQSLTPNPSLKSVRKPKSVLTTIPEVDEEIRQRFGRAVDTLAHLKRFGGK